MQSRQVVVDAAGGTSDIVDTTSFHEVGGEATVSVSVSSRAQPEADSKRVRMLGETSFVDMRARAFTFDRTQFL